jgi:hypothetical protein
MRSDPETGFSHGLTRMNTERGNRLPHKPAAAGPIFIRAFQPCIPYPRAPTQHGRMSTVVIGNPVINSPFDEPKRHFRFSDEGITNEIRAALAAWNRGGNSLSPSAPPTEKSGTACPRPRDVPHQAPGVGTARPHESEKTDLGTGCPHPCDAPHQAPGAGTARPHESEKTDLGTGCPHPCDAPHQAPGAGTARPHESEKTDLGTGCPHPCDAPHQAPGAGTARPHELQKTESWASCPHP